MTEYLSIQASFCFAATHIFIRRGLLTSNALTGSFVSISVSAVTLWILTPFFVPWSSFWTRAVWYFVVGGIFAPGLGRMLSYKGLERLGVARSAPISSSSPLLASLLAVWLMGEPWTALNFAGTLLVITGVVVLSRSQAAKDKWRKVDMIYPLLAAFAFGISSNLRKLGLLIDNLPLMAAAVTATTGLVWTGVAIWCQDGGKDFKLPRRSLGWFIAGGMTNTAAMLSVFYALSFGHVVIVEPLISTNPVLAVILTAIFLRDVEVVNLPVVVGTLCAVAGTLLVVLR